MRNYRLLMALTIAMIVGLGGCTSKKVENESTDAAALTGDESSGEVSEGGDEVSELSDDFGGEEGGETEVAEAAGEDGAEAAEGDSSEAGDEVAGEEEEGNEEDMEVAGEEDEDGGEEEEGVDALETAETTTEPAAPTAEVADTGSDLKGDEMSGLSSDNSTTETAPAEEPAPRPVVALKKMLAAPYTKNGTVVNALYVARQGDSLEAVSQKIYGQDRVADLKQINPHVANRSLKVGDKIYYNSPQRPADEAQMMVYYEDINLSPEIYEVTKDGENIRTIAKDLLGDENSWKEVWATNMDVESKDVLEVGTRLRYWSNSVAATAAPAVAAAEPPAAEPVSEAPPTEVASNEPPQMPEEAAAAAGSTEPPPPEMTSNEPPPPPPAVSEPSPAVPPPPAPVAREANEPTEDMGGATAMADDQMVWFALGGAVLLAAVALLIIARKRKAKKGIDFQTATHTQIE